MKLNRFFKISALSCAKSTDSREPASRMAKLFLVNAADVRLISFVGTEIHVLKVDGEKLVFTYDSGKQVREAIRSWGEYSKTRDKSMAFSF
jgi:hypothetical protein